MNIKQAYRSIRQLKWMSPGCFLLCAVSFAAIYFVLHVLGFREYTSIFCGTLPADRTEQTIAGFCGIMYTLFHMLAVLVAPILLIAAALFHIASRHLLCQRWKGLLGEPGPTTTSR